MRFLMLFMSVPLLGFFYNSLTDGAKKRINATTRSPPKQANNKPTGLIYVIAIPPKNIDRGINP